jgi:hypothetical protein
MITSTEDGKVAKKHDDNNVFRKEEKRELIKGKGIKSKF